MPPENNYNSVPEQTPTPAPAPIPLKKSPISVPAAIISGAAIIAIAIFFTVGKGADLAHKNPAQQAATGDQQPTSVPANVATLRSTDYIRGNKNADTLIFEYSDSDCPYCQQFHPELVNAVNNSNGTVAWVYRFFPLSIHPNAYTEALALSCVGQLGGNDTFWKYLDTIMFVTLSPTPDSNKALTTFATQDGIDAATFESCLKNPSSTAQVDSDMAEAQSIGAKGTPFAIAVNKKTGKQVVIPGAVPADYLQQQLDSLN